MLSARSSRRALLPVISGAVGRARIARSLASIARSPSSGIASFSTSPALHLYRSVVASASTRSKVKAPAKAKKTTKPAGTRTKTAKGAVKKAAPKTTRKVKKAVKTVKRSVKRERTPEQLLEIKRKEQRERTRELVEASLIKQEPTRVGLSTWTHFFSLSARQASGGMEEYSSLMKETRDKYLQLSAAEREKLQSEVNTLNASRKQSYEAWVKSFTPNQIRLANSARRSIRLHLVRETTGFKRPLASRYGPILDPRQVPRPRNAVSYYIEEQGANPNLDFKGESRDRLAHLSKTFAGLSAAEKSPYLEKAQRSKEQYRDAYKRVYGVSPPSAVAR